jgi:5-methyltetrahydrofolate--homocysteine methyltransferase
LRGGNFFADFINSGADVIETNTFGALSYLFKEFKLSEKSIEIISEGVKIARDVAKSFNRQIFVSGSMGPGTKLPSLRQISFKELYKDYFQMAECFIKNQVDLFQIETCQDMLQTKIALIASLDAMKKYNKLLPIFIQATISENGQMLVGTDLETFINTFEGFDIAGIGINCGNGPQELEKYIKILNNFTNKFIVALPNAGKPVLCDGKLSYDLTPKEFATHCCDLLNKYRINAIGGCCGTTNEFIKALSNIVPKTNYICSSKLSSSSFLTSLNSSTNLRQEPAPLMIGERCNVNGSKLFRKLLKQEQWDEMVEIALLQEDEGSHAIDINLNCLERDEIADMKAFIPLVNQSLSVPMMIDSTNYNALLSALECTSGKVIVNSTNFENGDDKVIEYIKLCRDYNAALVCLTIDENGMAMSFEHKKIIISRFFNLCEKHNFPLNNIFIDCLTFSLSTGEENYRLAAKSTIETIKYISTNFKSVNTVLGISNISFGFKNSLRKILNSVFLNECVKNGLTSAIVDTVKIIPLNQIPKEEIDLCLDLIYNIGDPLEKLLNVKEIEDLIKNDLKPDEKLTNAVINGRISDIKDDIDNLLKIKPPLSIINEILMPAMMEVGNLFNSGKMQLPFVLKSAEVMKKCVDYLSPQLTESSQNKNVSMLIATVKGDVHDIGKNLVNIILSNNGFKIYDIGVKKTPEEILTAVLHYSPDCLGLSALIIQSTEYMRETLTFLKQNNISLPVICGGAALTEDFVIKQLKPAYDGEVVYAKDAFSGLEFIKNL